MSQALYRKYRSRTLDEVLGQDHVTSILRRALEKGKIAHAYLLTGPRGTGKTSVARILAHEINQLPYTKDTSHLDIIEIDAASNNGVDDIRNLREKARIAPVSAKRKIYIIDEVHMLSKPAFNALLKTLEEPPEHVVFILATTDADKLPATILSRVQQYYFRPITVPIITAHLMDLAKREGFLLDEAAAMLIAKQSRGGFRDSISLLDQLSSLASNTEALTEAHVAASLGLSSEALISELLAAYDTRDSTAILSAVTALEAQGAHPVIITTQLLSILRERLTAHPTDVTLISQLIDVTKHPHPDLKLLTALLPADTASVTSAPLSQKTAIKTKQLTTPAPKHDQKPATTPASKPTTVKTFSGTFTWQSFIDEAKKQSMGLFSLLSKCAHEYKDGTLTLYAGTAFAKKKLDTPKNIPLINQVLQQSHGEHITVVINEGIPPSNERVAAVAAMMGGGEEVNLEDIS